MKKKLLIFCLFSLLLISCEFTIGDNVNCNCKCCNDGQTCTKTEQTNSDSITDEHNIEEDTTVNF